MATILVVEDDAFAQRAIEHVLGSLGHTVEVVSNGRKAMPLLKGHAYDLVVTDLLMPQGTGFEVLEWLKENARGLPVVVCSAYAREDALRTFLEKHSYAVVHKPFRPEALADAVSKLLEGRGYPPTTNGAN